MFKTEMMLSALQRVLYKIVIVLALTYCTLQTFQKWKFNTSFLLFLISSRVVMYLDKGWSEKLPFVCRDGSFTHIPVT